MTAVVLLLAGCAAKHDSQRLSWAATNQLHFVDAVVAADNYRAAAGSLAMKKSSSPELREFGRLLWEESTETNSRLKWLLMKTEPGVVLPSGVFPRDMFVIDELIPADGEEFDRRFIAQQIASLEQSLALAQGYSRAGDDHDLKDFAERSVPKIQMQLDRLNELKMRLG
jgi:putative membrane protein